MNAPVLTRLASAAPRESCHPHELPSVLDGFRGIEVLSLDCFDTLLWRDCHAPTDLFAALPGMTLFQRAHGEARARAIAASARGAHDVTIAEIYDAIMPNADAAARERAIEAEIAAEARHCYGFAPTIALMHEARRRGLKVIIVSDTYFSPRQLHDLIARAAGDDVAGMIDRVFTSSVHGLPKALGLYREVLAQIGAAPASVLHIGDNHAADVEGVRPFGVNTLHLTQFASQTLQQLRLESAVAAMIDGHRGGLIQNPQPHRPALSAGLPHIADPAQAFGFATLGPVFHGFDQWLRAEADALAAARDKPVHWLFLMRDGWLPMAMHQARGSQPNVHAVEISRLTATFATFTRDAAIIRHLEENRGIDPAILAQQLRLAPDLIAQLCGGRSHADGWRALADWCRDSRNRSGIVAAAHALADRLVRHVAATVAPQPGDTLMLVDLGYNGSVQSLVDRLLAERLRVHVAGRYLILREVQVTGHDKRGYLGGAHDDPVLQNALTANVALIEQLATTAQGSVIDYAEDGTPLRDDGAIRGQQSVIREAVQAGCLEFSRAIADLVVRGRPRRDLAQWRAANCATLLRLMYLPLREELALVEAFEHDVNLGTDERLALFDPAVARKGLLAQGLFYQKGARRMYLPAELAEAGLPVRLAHLATARFHMPLLAADFAGDAGTIPVVLSRGGEAVRVDLPYRPTHDGWFALCIPAGAGTFAAAVPFGALAPFVEVHRAVAMPATEYLAGRHDSAQREVAMTPELAGITALTPRLWHCPDDQALALFAPPPSPQGRNMVTVVIFRPIV